MSEEHREIRKSAFAAKTRTVNDVSLYLQIGAQIEGWSITIVSKGSEMTPHSHVRYSVVRNVHPPSLR